MLGKERHIEGDLSSPGAFDDAAVDEPATVLLRIIRRCAHGLGNGGYGRGLSQLGHGFKEVHVALGQRGECGGAHIALEIVA